MLLTFGRRLDMDSLDSEWIILCVGVRVDDVC